MKIDCTFGLLSYPALLLVLMENPPVMAGLKRSSPKDHTVVTTLYCSSRLTGVSLSLSSHSKRSGQKQEVSTGVEEVTRSKDLMKSQSLKLDEVICSWRNKSATAAVSEKIPSVPGGDSRKSPFYL